VWYSNAAMEHLKGLNAAQQEAVCTINGAVLVLAGAGSGKTRVITHRILEIIRSGVPANRILAVTFTNKAAAEMRERLHTLLSSHAIPDDFGEVSVAMPTATTFHSLGVRILREHHERLGLPKHFAIYDRSDTMRAIKSAMEAANYSVKEFEPKNILSAISKAKGEGETPEQYLLNAKSYGARAAGEVWKRYEIIMREAGALDFDDLLIKTYNLLRDHEDIRKGYQERWQYIHVDEFQDTNKIQMETLRLLAEHGNVCVVGDVDQSIYSWRGAQIKNLLQFEEHFPDVKQIKLEENYRSTKVIIDASNAIIAKNKQRPDKTVYTNNEEGEPIICIYAENEKNEAREVAKKIKGLIDAGTKPSGIAIIYRMNFQSRVLEEAMITKGVPYQLLGTKFFERAEVKDVLSYLRYILSENKGDFARIINVPKRGIGKVSMDKILAGDRQTITPQAKGALMNFDIVISKLREKVYEQPVDVTLRAIIEDMGLEASLRAGGDEGEERLQNVYELVALATKYSHLEPNEAVEQLLEESALQSDQDEIGNKEDVVDAVRLMTIHSSKGLEFPHVFITGLEKGLFPHEGFDPGTKRDNEEERRLFYVALTRAGKRAYLSMAQSRMVFGSTRYNEPSPFIGDIPHELIEEERPSAIQHRGIGFTPDPNKKRGLLDDDWGAETTVWL